jgi:alpha-glucosidase
MSALVVLALVASAGCHTPAGTHAKQTSNAGTHAKQTPSELPWWQDAVFYEVYPRSFQDSNGDGVGDLKGITSRLDYLADLGVDALWITPFYPSPQADFGYDVSDYENVDPQFGTLSDFDELVREAHRRHIHVTVDLVLNHTSDQHPLFKAARSSKTSQYRDFYIWRDPDRGGPPNNWYAWSGFSPSAWELDPTTGQYFYHTFLTSQPDLNWRNPEVEKRFFGSAKFWLDRGVDGFRLDAFDCLVEDDRFRDNPIVDEKRPGSSEHAQYRLYNSGRPETHEVLRRLRRVTDAAPRPAVLIAEIFFQSFEDFLSYYGHGDEAQLPFNFSLMRKVKRLDAALIRRTVEDSERALDGRATNYVLSNHDARRAYSRFSDGVHDDAIAKLLATLLLTLRGAPFIYYGEELGMPNHDPDSVDQVRDPVGKLGWPQNKGRDGERTPMQWSPGPQAGFTTGAPWLRIPDSATTRNVAVESADPESVLSFYKELLHLRRSSPALRLGAYATVGNDPNVYVYRRERGSQVLLVALNFSSDAQALPLLASTISPRILLSSTRAQRGPQAQITLEPFEAVIVDVSPAAR